MTKRIILYFSATGNSLYAAQQLAGEEGKAVSIPRAMKRKEWTYEAEEIGFVFPSLTNMPPNLVREFLAKASLKADYFFTIITCGWAKGAAPEIWQQLAQSAGIDIHYIQPLLMVNNWIQHADIEEELTIDKQVGTQLATIQTDLQARRHFIPTTTDEERAEWADMLERGGLTAESGMLMKSEKRFAANDECIRCGICTRVCPRGNWHLGGLQAENYGQCDYCLACINNCPRKAIQFVASPLSLLPPERNPARRYRNPDIQLYELEIANAQYDRYR